MPREAPRYAYDRNTRPAQVSAQHRVEVAATGACGAPEMQRQDGPTWAEQLAELVGKYPRNTGIGNGNEDMIKNALVGLLDDDPFTELEAKNETIQKHEQDIEAKKKLLRKFCEDRLRKIETIEKYENDIEILKMEHRQTVDIDRLQLPNLREQLSELLTERDRLSGERPILEKKITAATKSNDSNRKQIDEREDVLRDARKRAGNLKLLLTSTNSQITQSRRDHAASKDIHYSMQRAYTQLQSLFEERGLKLTDSIDITATGLLRSVGVQAVDQMVLVEEEWRAKVGAVRAQGASDQAEAELTIYQLRRENSVLDRRCDFLQTKLDEIETPQGQTQHGTLVSEEKDIPIAGLEVKKQVFRDNNEAFSATLTKKNTRIAGLETENQDLRAKNEALAVLVAEKDADIASMTERLRLGPLTSHTRARKSLLEHKEQQLATIARVTREILVAICPEGLPPHRDSIEDIKMLRRMVLGLEKAASRAYDALEVTWEQKKSLEQLLINTAPKLLAMAVQFERLIIHCEKGIPHLAATARNALETLRSERAQKRPDTSGDPGAHKRLDRSGDGGE